MKSMLRKSLPVALLLLLGFFTNFAFAAGGGAAGGDTVTTTGSAENAFGNVKNSVCQVAKGLRGPVGIAVGFLVLVAGLIAMQVANRDAIPMISRAMVGTALLLGASAAFSAIVTNNNCT
jgi:hypothetical protein